MKHSEMCLEIAREKYKYLLILITMRLWQLFVTPFLNFTGVVEKTINVEMVLLDSMKVYYG